MVLPLFLLIAIVALIRLTLSMSSEGDETLTLIVGSMAVACLIWLFIEVIQLSESLRSRGGGSSDPDDL